MVRRLTYSIYSPILLLLLGSVFFGCGETISRAERGLSGLMQSIPDRTVSRTAMDAYPSDAWAQTATPVSGGALALLHSLDAERFLSVSSAGEVLLWNSAGERGVLRQADEATEQAHVALSPKGRYFARAHARTVEIYDLQEGVQVNRYAMPVRVATLSFAFDARTLFVGGTDGFVYRVATAGERQIEKYAGHPTVVSAISTVPQTELFVSGDWDGSFLVWIPYELDPAGGRFRRSVLRGDVFVDRANSVVGARGRGVAVARLLADSNGRMLLVAFRDGRVELWSRRGLRLVATIPAQRAELVDVTMSASGDRVVSLLRDGRIRVWDVVESYSEVQEQTERAVRMRAETVNSSLRHLAMSSSDRLYVADDSGRVFEIDVAKLIASGGE